MFGKRYKNMAKISDVLQNFIMSNPKRAMKFMSSMSASFWERQGRKRALSIFHEAAEKVPAYKRFLKLKEVNSKEIKTFEDFQKRVPIIDKKITFYKILLKTSV
jgi:phenylacetate-coenzyme A ligase PaaK-like adenylate-forming protein